MKRTDLFDWFQTLLQRIPYITIATVCPDGQPWNSPVVGTFDENLNVYWVSGAKNQHSQNIAGNERIFIVIYDSHAPLGEGEGLYFKMRARSLETCDEIAEAHQLYDASLFEHAFEHPRFFGECPQRIYKAVPEAIWYNSDCEEQGHAVDMRKALFITK